MAMGVARGRSPGDFRLSVRIQARGARGRVLAEEVRARTRGEVDIRFTPHVVRRAAPPPSWLRRLRRPLEPGLSVGQGQDMAGTLGAIVEDAHAFYVLSNNHVLANVNRAEPGSPVSQPGDLDRNMSSKTLIGVLDRFVPISFSRSNIVDCALAEIWALTQAVISATGKLSATAKEYIHGHPPNAPNLIARGHCTNLEEAPRRQFAQPARMLAVPQRLASVRKPFPRSTRSSAVTSVSS